MPRFKHPELAEIYERILIRQYHVEPDKAQRILRVAGPFSEQAVQWAEFLRRYTARHGLHNELFPMLVEAQQNRRRRLFAVLRQCGKKLLPPGVTAYELPWLLEGAVEALRP